MQFPHFDKKAATALGLILLSLFIGLGAYDLSAPDEPRFALVAQEMLRDGHWLMPHRNERPYPDKPPLFFWSIAAVSWLLGGEVTAWSARLPNALAALGVLCSMFLWARREPKEGRATAWTTLFVLLTTFRFVISARSAQIDMLLCLCVTVSILLGYRSLTGGRSQPWLLGLCLGAGILAKGPVGYLIPVGVWCVFCLFRRNWRGFPVKAMLWGLLPPLIWILLLSREVIALGAWDYFHNLLFKQTVTRAFDPWHHHKPWYYLFQVFLHDGLPWSLALIAAIPFRRKARALLDDHRLLAWSAVVFTFFLFSLSSGKRSVYILPLYPFAAYLVAAWLSDLEREARRAWSARAPLLVSGLLLAIVGLALVGIALGWLPIDIPPLLQETMPVLALSSFGVLLAVLAVGTVVAVTRARWVGARWFLVSGMAVLHTIFFLVVMPYLSPYRSARRFTEEATEIISRNDPDPVVGMVGYRSANRLYGEYPLVELALPDPRFQSDPPLPDTRDFFRQYPDGWLIVRAHDWEAYEDTISRRRWLSMGVGRGDTYLLLGPQQPSGSK